MLADLHPGPDGVEFWVLKNGSVLGHELVPDSGSGTVDLTRMGVSSGDSLYVVLGPGPAGEIHCDSTQVDFAVSKVK